VENVPRVTGRPPADRSAESLRAIGERQKHARYRKAGHIIGLLNPFMADRRVSRVLSIGAGFCFIDDCLREELFPNAEVISTDINVERLHSFDQPALVKRAISATDLDYPDETFDVIIAHQVLEHINDYPRVLDKLAVMCRKGGLIYVNVPNPISPAVGKIPDGTWPRPFLKAFVAHNCHKFRRDFLTNTEKYHTGFTRGVLRRHLRDYHVVDLRKARLRQELPWRLAGALIKVFPPCLLFLFVESNIWVCIRQGSSPFSQDSA